MHMIKIWCSHHALQPEYTQKVLRQENNNNTNNSNCLIISFEFLKLLRELLLFWNLNYTGDIIFEVFSQW